MSQFPYAAIATRRKCRFVGGKPFVGLPTEVKREQKVCLAALGDDFVPDFVSSKISAHKATVASTKECLLRSPFSKYYSFSVNDCPRKVQSNKEKRRNRKIWEQEKMRICTTCTL